MEFIYRVENALSPELCQEIIEKFEKSPYKGEGITGSGVNESIKKSIDLSFFSDSLVNKEMYNEWNNTLGVTVSILNKHVQDYIEKYPFLKIMDAFKIEAFNIQKYEPGGGFYTWHCESSVRKRRVLVFMFYLNDVNDGGTEFMAQNHVETAKMGKLLIWPPDWTHAHRGQVSFTETKYILTGWYSVPEFN